MLLVVVDLPIRRPTNAPHRPSPPPEKVRCYKVDSEKKLQFKLINFFTFQFQTCLKTGNNCVRFANPEV